MSFKSVKLDHCSSQENNAKIAKVVSNVAWQCSDHLTMPPIFPTLASAACCAVYYSGYCCTTTGQ